jgi:hypothetical protein
MRMVMGFLAGCSFAAALPAAAAPPAAQPAEAAEEPPQPTASGSSVVPDPRFRTFGGECFVPRGAKTDTSVVSPRFSFLSSSERAWMP